VTREEKLALLAEMPKALGGMLQDTNVREAEALTLPESPDGRG
jgi:hypothetical protein